MAENSQPAIRNFRIPVILEQRQLNHNIATQVTHVDLLALHYPKFGQTNFLWATRASVATPGGVLSLSRGNRTKAHRSDCDVCPRTRPKQQDGWGPDLLGSQPTGSRYPKVQMPEGSLCLSYPRSGESARPEHTLSVSIPGIPHGPLFPAPGVQPGHLSEWPSSKQQIKEDKH